MFQRHSAVSHAAYHDLRRALLDDAISDIRGTVSSVTRGGRVYWYDSYRVGSDVRKRYIGPDSTELQQRLAMHDALKVERRERQENRARLVRLLRAEGFLSVDGTTGSLFAALSGAGLFRLGGTVVGTNAFRLYEGELGVRFAFDQSAMTNDIDIASFERLSLALEDRVVPPVGEILAGFAFEPVPSLDAGKVWRWRQSRNELHVEFLTPSFREEEDLRPLEAFGVNAQSLHFLNYLIADPVPAVALYRGGVLIQVPRVERYAVHKLIVANRRKGDDALKAQKDRMQAAFLIEVLAQDRPDDLAMAWQQARDNGLQWTKHMDTTLKSLPQTCVLLSAL